MAFSCVETSPHNKSSVLQNVAMTLKVLLLSAGMISTVIMVKGALLPFSCEIVLSSVVGFWNSIRCVLSSPLYICIIINSMVLLIAASSTFHHQETDNHDPPPPPQRLDLTEVEPQRPQPKKIRSRPEKSSTSSLYQCIDHDHDHDNYSHNLHYNNRPVGKANLSSPDEIKETADSPYVSPDLTEKMEAEESSYNLQLDEKENEDEEEEGTMEATWKAITGAKTKRQLKKSETWQITRSSLHSEEAPASSSTWKLDLKKSETFNEAVSKRRIGGMMRDPSVDIDEFNQKVEAFINKFNEDMRLQRQESDQRFVDMINRGL